MSTYEIMMNEALYAYVDAVSNRERPVLAELRAATEKATPWFRMQITPMQGQFMEVLVTISQAKRALEVGTFTGYSALAVALALPPDGRILACDVNEETSAVARRYWAEAGVSDKIDLRLAPAGETLAGLIAEGQAGSYDFAFIDADKVGYDGYYEACLELLRPGGLIAVDNVLWSGAVADPEKTDPDTKALRALNEKLRDDARVGLSLVPIGDGLTLARKRPSGA